MSCSILKGLNIFLVDISSRKMKLMNLWQNVKKMRTQMDIYHNPFLILKKILFIDFHLGHSLKMFKVIDTQKQN